MRVLGIDTSTTSTGVAIIDHGRATTLRIESGPPRRPRGDKTPASIRERHDRLRRIVHELSDAIFPMVDSGPVLAVVEGPSYASAGAGTWDRAWLWGAVITRLYTSDVDVAICPPSVRTKWATGSGKASKTLVGVYMSRMWPDLDVDLADDEWDALALASIGAQQVGILPCELARHREQLAKVAWPESVSDLPKAG